MEAKLALAPRKESTDRKAYIVTGPTSGIGRATALELAKYGTIILVGRNPKKLDETRAIIERTGGRAVSVVCDLSDPASVRHTAAEIGALRLPIAGLLNNAGIRQTRPTKNVCGWDMSFATNHLGPFALTEALIPHLPDGANVVFVVSAVEDPERKPARLAGFRGGRYISAEASARGEWRPGGSKRPGLTPTRRPSKRSSRPRWLSRERRRACGSTPSSRASIRPQVSAALAASRAFLFCCSCRFSSRS